MLSQTLAVRAAPPSPFAGWTGKGVKLAVIDSGVHAGHGHIGSIEGGLGIAPDGGILVGADAWSDRLGHGTAVTAAIQEKAPDAQIHVLKVFHDSLRSTATALLAGIDWCVDNGMDVVNLSLGSANPSHRLAFAEAARRAETAGVLLIAPLEAEGAPCFPGSLEGVLGVGLDWDHPRDGCRAAHRGEPPGVYASGYPRPIPGVEPRRNLYGVSFAVANVSGLAARGFEALGRGQAPRDRAELVAAALLQQDFGIKD